MARPWPKRSVWPYVCKNGRKSYTVGFYDHDKRERSRSFPSARHARAWMDGYVTAERRGRDSLRRFLLDLDAREANEAEARTIGQLIELYFEMDAHPRNQGGLAPKSYRQYRWAAKRHILARETRTLAGERRAPLRHALAVVNVPAVRFNEPQAPRAWREEMMRAGLSPSIRRRAWVVMSAALTWAARSPATPEIQSNGCLRANERTTSRRRSARRGGGTGYAPATRRRPLARWALSPHAVEAIREQMLLRTRRRDTLLGYRDATIVSLHYGLAARSQEVWALRWGSILDSWALVTEVLSDGRVEEWGKTENSTRRTALPSLLTEDLAQWRMKLESCGRPTRDTDFIIPGNLAGPNYGVQEPDTGARHFSEEQAKSWRRRSFAPAVQAAAAAHPGLTRILGATPYALRRGGISLRLRTEDPQTVARECGTSLQMLNTHYTFALEDLRRQPPRPADIEWRARAALLEQRANEQAPSVEAADDRIPSPSKLRTWFGRMRRSG
jgi:hypothetical protein